jgi:DNA-binding beta-propeller fold protein YncE
MSAFGKTLRRVAGAFSCATVLTLLSSAAAASESYTLFESGQVRPLALSPSGRLLLAVNTPDNRLEIFLVAHRSLIKVDSVPVGLEPVAVAMKNENEAWVVNHVSDSVSIVDIGPLGLGSRVVKTLLVGDEPRDIVFAGPQRKRAFITTAHRGQNIPFNPQLTTPGVGRADVWVYNSENLNNTLNGGPLNIITLFTDSPRALAVSPNGQTVYAAGHKTGNQTTTVTEFLGIPPTPPNPAFGNVNYAGVPQPQVGTIVKFNGTTWVNEAGLPGPFPGWPPAGPPYAAFVRFNLPDKDVFTINAMANPPVEVASGFFTSVGTILYNMAVNPVSGKVYVSNTDAANVNRFEGPGIFAGHTVRGQHNQNRITVLQPGGSVTPRHLNKHIDFDSCCAPVPNAESELSVALPLEMAVSKNGTTMYVAMLGSSKIGVYNTAQLENDTFFPDEDDQIAVSGGGPSGVVLDEPRRQLYVLTRFDNSISIVDTQQRREVNHVSMFNPEPQSVTRGRRFLYDATISAHGDSACATCHVFSDNDDLGWNLGNPDDDAIPNANPTRINLPTPFGIPPLPFPAMKGPLTTQSLRGMANHGPMHWRGDRTGSAIEPNAQPDSGAFNEREALRQFQAGFVGLLGRSEELPAADMEAYIDFQLQVMYPPNPNQNLDGSWTADQQAGLDFFFDRISDSGVITCEGCHRTDRDANSEFGVQFPGFFGADGMQASEVFPQFFKIPHLRNIYTKVGMFGFPTELSPLIELADPDGFTGDQIRGFGVSRAGDIDTPFRFLHATNFSTNFVNLTGQPNPDAFAAFAAGDPERRQVEQFLLAFPTNHRAIVGQQITITENSGGNASTRLGLLIQRANAGDCDLIAKGDLGLSSRGFVYLGGGVFLSDRGNNISTSTLLAAINRPRETLTFTCAPLGSGYRMGVDRDDDGVLDGNDHHLD